MVTTLKDTIGHFAEVGWRDWGPWDQNCKPARPGSPRPERGFQRSEPGFPRSELGCMGSELGPLRWELGSLRSEPGCYSWRVFLHQRFDQRGSSRRVDCVSDLPKPLLHSIRTIDLLLSEVRGVLRKLCRTQGILFKGNWYIRCARTPGGATGVLPMEGAGSPLPEPMWSCQRCPSSTHD